MNDAVNKILRNLRSERNLGRALDDIEAVLAGNSHLGFEDRLFSIRREFNFMMDFFSKGYKDSAYATNYDAMLVKAYTLAADINIRQNIEKLPYLANHYKIINGTDVSSPMLISLLEGTRSNPANRYTMLSFVFHTLLLSPMWKESDSRLWTAFLLSDTTPSEESLTIVSALMLSLKGQFCIEKYSVLANVYTSSDNEYLRQRALVALAVCHDLGNGLFMARQEDIISQICMGLSQETGNDVAQSCMELIVQMKHCMNAEKDNEEISRNIMPKLVKGNGLKIGINGIEKFEDDQSSIDEVINPGASELKMEEMENGVKRMLEMQKAGSDIYFHGFKHMKRYPFFHKIMNWFLPFSLETPEVSEAMSRLGNSPFMEKILKTGPFCDSDKYSFAFTMMTVFDKIPENMRKMMDEGEMAPIGMTEEFGVKVKSPAYIRRMYLLDLYRFYNLFPYGKFDTIFELMRPTAFFIKIMGDNVDATLCELGNFLLRNSELRALNYLLNNTRGKKTKGLLMLNAYYCQRTNNMEMASRYYRDILLEDPDDVKALAGEAKYRYSSGDYEDAVKLYGHLLELKPEDKNIRLRYLLAKIGAGDAQTDRASELLNEAYRLDFECPDDISVKRVIAWALLSSRRYEQAADLLVKICDGVYGVSSSSDNLNAAYAKCLLNDFTGMMNMLSNYVKELGDIVDKESIISSFKHDFESDIRSLHMEEYEFPDKLLLMECIRRMLKDNVK